MFSCWTCGAPTSCATHRCPECQQVNALTRIGDDLEGSLQREAMNDMGQGLLQIAQLRAVEELSKVTAQGFNRVCESVRWSTVELGWRLEQQHETLKNIDSTLRTPSETQSNEFRQMAETLLKRGVLNDAQEFYEKALALNRIDYRTYVGLADTLIQKGQFQDAIDILQRSLPHAPLSEPNSCFENYKSYSLRLIARCQEALGNTSAAFALLKDAVAFSPSYLDGHYDLARIACALGDDATLRRHLSTSIEGGAAYWHFARHEKGFYSQRQIVQEVLRRQFDVISNQIKANLGEVTSLVEVIARDTRALVDKYNTLRKRKLGRVVRWALKSTYDFNRLSKLASGSYEQARHRIKSLVDKANTARSTANYEMACETLRESAAIATPGSFAPLNCLNDTKADIESALLEFSYAQRDTLFMLILLVFAVVLIAVLSVVS